MTELNQPLPCIVCGTNPRPAFSGGSDAPWQPSGATMFDAGGGNYGSTVWDEGGVSGRSLWINVCDICLVDRKGRVAVVTRIDNPQIDFEPWKGPWTDDDDG